MAVYEALGWPVPEFAHLSTILGADRERLSKRHGATSIANFRGMGVLPEALVNYLALLGWAPTGGTREIFSLQELVKEFSLQRVTPSPAVFDMEKLYWLNRHYIKQRPAAELYETLVKMLSDSGTAVIDDHNKTPQGFQGWFLRVIELLIPSVDRLDQFPERTSLIFHYDAKAALASPDNAEVLGWANTDAVLMRFAGKILEDESAREGTLTAGTIQENCE